jgi:acetyl esterase/lipase
LFNSNTICQLKPLPFRFQPKGFAALAFWKQHWPECKKSFIPETTNCEKEVDEMRLINRQALLALLMLAASAHGAEGTLRERLAERRAERLAERQATPPSDAALNPDRERRAGRVGGRDVVRELNVAYGSDPAQRFDVYRPVRPVHAPILVLVHGGGWRNGDKRHAALVENKVPHWVGLGYIVVSTNYRLLPVPVDQQAEDVALAVDTVRAKAATWGGDPERVVLMGHSAGAHLVALLNARAGKPQPWRGVVALDSGAFDVEALMKGRHMPLFDDAFGSDPTVWRSLSPYAQLTQAGRPLLAVCSSQRQDPCPDAQRYADKARQLGGQADVYPVDLSHKEINQQLGLDSAYTARVDSFLASLVGR